jgi:hypothetical protein
MKQKEWIAHTIRENCFAVLEKTKKPLTKEQKKDIFYKVLDAIDSRGIWIPDHEVRKVFFKKVTRYQKKFFDKMEVNEKDVIEQSSMN